MRIPSANVPGLSIPKPPQVKMPKQPIEPALAGLLKALKTREELPKRDREDLPPVKP